MNNVNIVSYMSSGPSSQSQFLLAGCEILATDTSSRLPLLSEWVDDGHTIVRTHRR